MESIFFLLLFYSFFLPFGRVDRDEARLDPLPRLKRDRERTSGLLHARDRARRIHHLRATRVLKSTTCLVASPDHSAFVLVRPRHPTLGFSKRDEAHLGGDCVEKNKLRLEAPKGETGNSMSMF